MMFEDMTKVLNPGTMGKADLRIRELSGTERMIGCIHGNTDPGPNVIEFRVGGVLMMSDTPDERRSNYEPLRRSHGRVLIGGLGMGLLLLPILRKPEVEHVDVVEIDGDVIDFIGPQIGMADGKKLAHKLQFVHANVFTWKPQKGSKWNTIWMDIWPDICVDNLAQYSKLNRKYGRFLDRDDPACWIGCWQQERLRCQARRDKRSPW